MRKKLQILLAIILFVQFPLVMQATHIIGGNIGYMDLGPDPNTPGNRLYLIYLEVYMDCNSPFWGSTFPEPSVDIGVYEGELNPGSALSTLMEVTIPLVDSNWVDPNLPPICDSANLLFNACIYLVRYEQNLSLPQSNLGYWVVYERCCRPGGIFNLSNSQDQGFSFLSWIPSNGAGLLPNTSPQFNDTLISLICRTDTAYLSNGTIDPDGDSLVYSLVEPYKGYLGDGAPGNPPPQASYMSTWLNPYSIPPPGVTWAPGFNQNNLFGSSGYQDINSSTGLTKFVSMQTGTFVATVEILEYRNGQVVGVTRRNIQLISDNCPNNHGPAQDTTVLDSAALSPTTYVIQAGDSICFDLHYTDADGDPMEFSASGSIFDPGQTNPPATFIPAQGVGSVTGTICWATSCAQGSTTPYTFQTLVVDSNCPPIPLIQDINIIVMPFSGPTQLLGDSIVCINQNSTANYSVAPVSGANYNWTVTGGTIVSGQGTNAIVVDWSGATTGQVSVTVSSQFGCSDGPLIKNIIISNMTPDAGPDTAMCAGDTIMIGGNPTVPNPNATIIWSPGTGLDNPSAGNPMASPSVTTTYIVNITDSLGCMSSDTMTLVVNNTQPSGLDPDYYLCPGDTLQVTAQGSSFLWSPNTFISNTTIANPKLYPPNSTSYFLDYKDMNGCEGTDTIAIDVSGTVPTNAGPDALLCTGDTLTLGGSPTAPQGTSFQWMPNVNLSSTTDANPLAWPSAIGPITYYVQTSNDTCHGIDSVVINVVPLPALSTTPDTIMCFSDTIAIGAFGNGVFVWNNGSTLSDSTIANPLAFPISSTVYHVTITDANGCEKSDSVVVDVQPLPMADAGGLQHRCKWTAQPIGGSPTGPQGATYQWSPSTGLMNPADANPLFYYDSDMTYFVTVTDSIGCRSFDTAVVEVFLLGSVNNDTVICHSDNVQLNVTLINPVGAITYLWQPGKGLSDSTIADPVASPDTLSAYTIYVEDGTGCRDTGEVSIALFDKVVGDFKLTSTLSCDNIRMEVENATVNASEYIWLLNGVEISRDEHPVFNLPYASSDVLTLITISTDGCSDTTDVTLSNGSFEDLVDYKISNVFTPNGDGINDFFEVTSNGDLKNCTNVKVFNRNGALIFESSGGIHVWDGRNFSGQEMPDGTYFFIIEVNGASHHGTVTLMR